MKKEFNPTTIRLVIGIGNPETRYQHTYHNAGIQFIEYCKEKTHSAPQHKKGYFSYFSAQHIIFASSLLPMNGSGTSLVYVCKFFKITPSQILVAHDDSDLLLGTYRIHYNRGAAGHHGIESIIAAFHTKSFFRARIGIRPPHEPKRASADTFVLRQIPHKDREVLRGVFSDLYSIIITSPLAQTHQL